MPTYDYQCQACHHCLESFQKISDKPLKKCPECGKNTLQKQISAPAFQLKGSGWYVTDFRDKAKKEDKKPETSTETTKTSETSDTKPSVDKPEKKPEPKAEKKETTT